MASSKAVTKSEDEVKAVERDDWTYNLSGDFTFQEFVSKYDNGVGVSGNFVGYMYHGTDKTEDATKSPEDASQILAQNVESIKVTFASPDTDKEVVLQIKSDLQMSKVKEIYERLFGLPEKSVVFHRKDQILSDDATPISLKMFEGDEIQAFYIEDLAFHFNLEECFCRRHIHYRLLEHLLKDDAASGRGSAADSVHKGFIKTDDGFDGKGDPDDDDPAFAEGFEDEAEFVEEEEEVEEGEDYEDTDDDYAEEYVEEDDADEYVDDDDDVEDVDDDESNEKSGRNPRPSGKTVPEGMGS